MSRDYYSEINALWPASIPPLTRVEAERAQHRLTKKFGGYVTGRPVRRVWITTKRTASDSNRGWQRLVHDVSHRVNIRLYPNATGRRHHNGQHAEIEREMTRFVVLKSGWLDGKLKPPTKAKRLLTDADKLARVKLAMVRWESKRRRAVNALRKLMQKLRYYERKIDAR